MVIRVRIAQPGEGETVERMLAEAATPRPGLARTIDGGELAVGYDMAECYLVAHDRDTDTVIGALAASPPLAWLGRQVRQGGMTPDAAKALASVVAKLHSVVVADERRRQGMGRKLVLSAIAFYRSRDYKWMYGQFATGTALAPFYETLGFEVLEPGQDLLFPFGANSGMHGAPEERWFSTLL